MNGTWRAWAVAAVAGIVALGIAAAAVAQMDAIREYETRRRNTDMNDADQIFALAKWCYRNRLTDEALKHAVTAHRLGPEDVRAKYLIYALRGGPAEDQEETGGEAGAGGTETPPPTTAGAVSDERIEAVWEEETPAAMNAFRDVQQQMFQRCGTADCHGGNPQAKFNLITASPGSRQTIVRNFLTIRGYLDREGPEKSALVQMPMKGPDEGHPRKVIRSTNDRFYREAVKWIDQLLTEVEKVWSRSTEGGGAGG